MTTRLARVIERLQELSDEQQDAVAGFILSELEEDERWRSTTLAHEGKLGGLVAEILGADARGECDDLNPDKL